ncbi:peptide chain release factor 1 [Acanthopleuribacter pedis]|uniref:Peptide chain release factor 1 n=1 Tax=Acanthopleuribacter pedis TaxID=442870 RepID=A0A8J7Q526_9BACT|nr:peptide chain release factor 1 [Acanthopleuribacter pedis]
MKETVLKQLESIVHQFRNVEEQMADPSVIADTKRYNGLAKQYRELEPIIAAHKEYHSANDDLTEYESLLAGKNEDPELLEMAREALPETKEAVEKAFFDLQRLLLPKDPLDGKNVILEIRAGTGGDEAGLFAAEMFRAYQRFSEANGWKMTVSSVNESGIGGFKEVSAVVEGTDVFSQLKYESGTHRVQRVPKTESQGRVHTSAITVAILAEAEDVGIEVKETDLKVDTYRSSGAGGQHVNTTDSAVRLTHLPTGVVVQCQDERSQIKNKEKALKALRAHLYDLKLREQQEQIAADRKNMVGSGDRSEKIRTYNFPQGRVTDHRIKVTLYQLDDFMNGGMKEMIEACRTNFEARRINEAFGEQD